MIRLAVRCDPKLAERVLADLVELAPGGVEEVGRVPAAPHSEQARLTGRPSGSLSGEEAAGGDWVEYAIYGAAGELPELPDLEAIAGEGLVAVSSTEIPDDWADRWQDFHQPHEVGGRLWVRPSWAEPRAGAIDIVVDPGQAFGTGAHPTTGMCLELLLRLADEGAAQGALADWGTGSGVLAIAGAKLGFGPVVACDHEPAALESARANARANGVELELRRVNLRLEPPPEAPTVIANLTAPILAEIARRVERVPQTLICSGLLAAEAETVRRAFAGHGLRERLTRAEGDWTAILFTKAA